MSEALGFVRLDDGTVEYRVRDFNANDAATVGSMAAKVTGDPMVIGAMASGDENQILLAFATAIMEKVPRQLALFCADLVGETKGFDLDEWIRKEREEADKEERQMRTVGAIRERMNDAIIKQMDQYPGGAYPEILAELVERPGFEDFLVSSTRLGTAIPNAFSKLRSKSKNGSKSRTKK